MAGYPHDMGKAKEVWRKTIHFPEIGEVIILASIESAHLDPKEQDTARWIAQITFTIDMSNHQQNSRNSGYMFHEWFDTEVEAYNSLMKKLFASGPMILKVTNTGVV